MNRPKILFYHDGRHPHIYRYEPPMHPEEYVSLVDELAGTTIEAIAFCLGEGRTMLHDTRVGELLGHNIDSWDHIIFRRTWQNARSLIENGFDPLRLVSDRAVEYGIQLYPVLIVQRGGANHAADRCSDFRRDNPQYEIGAGQRLSVDHPAYDALDMKHPEARNERFAIFEEVIKEYSVDGFELHLNQMPYFFHPDEIEAGEGIMTDWIGRVYEALKCSGAQRELVVRLPNNMADCLQAGLNPQEWVKRGIVDALIPERFAENYRVKINADYGEFVNLCRGTACRVLAVVNSTVASDRLQDAPLPMIRATACNAWAQDVDGLYVSEWFHLWPYEASFYEKLRELPYPRIMENRDKYYFVPNESDRAFNSSDRDELPQKLALHRPVGVDVTITDDLHRWGEVGRVHEVLLRLRITDHVETDLIEFRLNGRVLPPLLDRKINQLYLMDGPRYRVMGGYWHVFKLDLQHWPRKGINRVEVELQARDADIDEPFCTLRDVELETKYLKGKNFHRSYVDPDLGDYEHRA